MIFRFLLGIRRSAWLGIALLHLATFDVYAGIEIKIRSSDGLEESLDLYSGYQALVIGVGDYKKGWRDLPNAVEDAKQIASMLNALGWKVDYVDNPTGQELDLKLNQLIVNSASDQEKGVLVWFSGHGHTELLADGTPLGFLVPSDAPNPNADLSGFISSALDMDRIKSVSTQIRAKHVLMVFDSCFSGTLFSVTRSAQPTPYIKKKVAKPVRQFITAGQAEETVPDESVFHKTFMAGIKDLEADLNEDGYVTGTEIGSYLIEKVTNYSSGTQNPIFGKIQNPNLDKGDFVFAFPSNELSSVVSNGQTKAKQDRRVVELEVWKGIKEADSPGLYQQFLEQFPDGVFAGLAQYRLGLLSVDSVTTETPQITTGNEEKIEPDQQEAGSYQAQRERDEQEAVSAFGAVAWAIQEEVRINWNPPAGDFEGFSVLFTIRVDREGNVTSVAMMRSSGNARFDESAANAIYKASPLPIPAEPRFYEYLKEFQFQFMP